MPTRVAINGFGRVGRAAFRAAFETSASLELVAINDLYGADALANVLARDSVYGEFPAVVEAYGDTLRVDEFIRQAEQYETGGDAWDTVLKILNTVMRTHPMHTVRAAELLRWQRSGGYDKVMAGEYTRRGASDQDQHLGEDYADAAGYYGAKTRETVNQFKDGLSRARDAVSNAWRNR